MAILKEETREEVLKAVGGKTLRRLGIIQLVLLIITLTSPFVWIWSSWDIAWKVFLTGFIGCCIVALIYQSTKKVMLESIDKEFKKHEPKSNRSKFQKRMDEMMNERKGNL